MSSALGAQAMVSLLEGSQAAHHDRAAFISPHLVLTRLLTPSHPRLSLDCLLTHPRRDGLCLLLQPCHARPFLRQDLKSGPFEIDYFGTRGPGVLSTISILYLIFSPLVYLKKVLSSSPEYSQAWLPSAVAMFFTAGSNEIEVTVNLDLLPGLMAEEGTDRADFRQSCCECGSSRHCGVA